MPSTRIKQNLTVIAFFAILSLSGLLWMAINTGQRFGPLPPQYRVSFNVRDADALADGAEVRVAGIPVGRVLSVETTTSGARVNMGIYPQFQPVYTDAQVLIRPKSLLGEKYVDMSRGHSNVEIPDGGSIPETQAFTQVELDQVLQSSDPATRAAFSTDIQSLGQGLAGRGADVNATIPELRTIAEHLTPVSARFKDRTAQIDHILVDTDTILSTLADEHQQLATLLQSADAVTGTIAQNDQHLANILTTGSDTIARLNVAVAQRNNDQNIRTAVETSPATLGHLNTLLSLTNKDVNTLLPSLLLASQWNYPSDQLTVTQPNALQLSDEWDSGYRIYDSANGVHGFLNIALQCSDNQGQNQPYCPGTYLNKNNGVPGAGRGTSMTPTADEQALLRYLMGQ
jgi:virulence factor Mce-like protein